MHGYVAYVQERGQAVPRDYDWDHVPVDQSSLAALQSSLGAREVFVRREEPVRAWHLVDADSLAEVVEGCYLKVVRAGVESLDGAAGSSGPAGKRPGRGRAPQVKRAYIIVGLQKKRHQFTDLSIIKFSRLQEAVMDRWHFFKTVQFNVYTERAVQDSNKAKGSADFQPLQGNELNEDTWTEHLRTLGPTQRVCVVVKAIGRPFPEYNGLSDEHMGQLVYDHTKFKLSGGRPRLDNDRFDPPDAFAPSEQQMEWGPASAAGSNVLEPAAPGQEALAAGSSSGGGAAASAAGAAGSHQQVHHRGAGRTISLRQLTQHLAAAMVCLLRALASGAPGVEEISHRGFIDYVLAGALMLAKSLRPNSKDRPYMKPEHALTGTRAWGKVDYLLVYRAFGIMVVEAKAGLLDSAWGQAFMELISMHAAMVRQLEEVTIKDNKNKRTAHEAFLVDKMSTYMLICNAWQYRLVLYTPGDNLWCSDTHMLPLATGCTPEGLAPQLEKLVRVLAYALTQQMDWLDTGLGDAPKQLVQAPPEASVEEVDDATKDYIMEATQQEEDAVADAEAQQQGGI